MIRGYYIGASGMRTEQERLNAISNNLANVNTTGYKRDVTISKAFPELLLRRTGADGVYGIPDGSADMAPVVGKIGLGVETNENYTEFDQGSLRQTETMSDLALGGEGFFCVLTPNGERYTRDGNFLVGKEGILETKNGFPVLGEAGYINVKEISFNVDENGVVKDSDNGEAIARVKIVRFDNEQYLKKIGVNLYLANENSGEAHIAEGEERPRLLQGFVETSNVNVVNEMVRMIEVNRAYEANQKTVKSADEMMTLLWSKTALYR